MTQPAFVFHVRYRLALRLKRTLRLNRWAHQLRCPKGKLHGILHPSANYLGVSFTPDSVGNDAL